MYKEISFNTPEILAVFVVGFTFLVSALNQEDGYRYFTFILLGFGLLFLMKYNDKKRHKGELPSLGKISKMTHKVERVTQ